MKHKEIITRKEKISLLQKIKEGKLNVDCLPPPRHYIFLECINAPGNYEMEGKQYTKTECLEFCEKLRDQDRVIIMNLCPGCEPIKDTISVTLNI